ncbi:Nitronate monooxygenase [Legionella massiliensis]|uniref:Nitronate monooxygenase n=1 Tax=Legionella massiliensis TaxID=1034943 RepID=A0A078KYC8_9GAMM|nr:nitronate monooxygenase [Legionella massiliensis]CDZ77921.1 Nitronate monooxygenase [Legionella massiliensis]CEE13659.1 Nitronate monooxygenase [Legionella massiliensis]
MESFTKRLGIQFPIIQAPMAGGLTTAELVAAVSNSGGLGSLGAAYMSADAIRKAIQQIRTLTDKPFAINLFIPNESYAATEQIQNACHFIEQACKELNFKIVPSEPPYAIAFDEQMAVVIEEKIPVFSCIFGVLPKTWHTELKNNKTIIMGTATNVAEAILLEQSGVDMIIAQGSEAGGHRGSFLKNPEDSLIGTFSLLPQLLDHLKLPVIAAGGIMEARTIMAALTLGASAVQMGTAFLACTESGIHPSYKEALLATKQDNTVLTTAFSGRLARGIRNKFIDRMEADKKNILPYPIQNAVTRAMRNEAAKQNCTDFMSMWAGQSAYLCEEMSVANLFSKLTTELNKIRPHS